METTPSVILPCRDHWRRQRLDRSRVALFVAFVGVITLALLPAPSFAEIFYGFADTTLAVSQQEGSGYQTLRTWSLPVTVKFRVATDFASSELLGIDLSFHKTIYEDASQNFGFSFGIEGTIVGAGPVDIDINPGTDDWGSDLYWDILDADITLDRRVFNSTNHFETHVFDDTVRLGGDGLNFSGYPGSITYLRQPAGLYWPLESIPYSDMGRLTFFLYSPGTVSLAPAICDHSGCGDYNQNGVVDAADYVAWRDTLGQSGQGLVADGNSNGAVEAADYEVWKKHFGATSAGLGNGQTSVPEPSASTLAVIAACAMLRRSLVGRRRATM